jgi:hypothetical protein
MERQQQLCGFSNGRGAVARAVAVLSRLVRCIGNSLAIKVDKVLTSQQHDGLRSFSIASNMGCSDPTWGWGSLQHNK